MIDRREAHAEQPARDIPMYQMIEGRGVPIKAWTRGVPVEDGARQQLLNVASLPFIYKHVAAMPDVHWGRGATVGSVIPTKGAIIPAAVGVDIGCGMMAVRTSLHARHLPDNLHDIRLEIERAVPLGTHTHKEVTKRADKVWYGRLQDEWMEIDRKHPGIASKKSAAFALGTLGGGNHFIELCLDEDDRLWVMLHSGSRNIGNRLGTYFIERAKKAMGDQKLVDKDLAWLSEGTEDFDDYVRGVGWAQDYAKHNRELMMEAVLDILRDHWPDIASDELAVNCHHNYVQREQHFGETVWLTRKGAVRAGSGEMGIIPGSMGARSFIVRGKGNPESFHSCSHGAGRKFSRTEAKRRITLKQHAEAMKGIEARLDGGVLDESPAAYKDIDAVMAAQADLVEIVHTLRQIVCVKG
jgi:tRNA-splicing ligase RtcB